MESTTAAQNLQEVKASGGMFCLKEDVDYEMVLAANPSLNMPRDQVSHVFREGTFYCHREPEVRQLWF